MKGTVKNKKEWAIRLCLLTLGLIIAQLGVTLFLISSLGTDTFTVFAAGISNTIHVPVGLCHSGIQCILIVLMILFTKNYIKTGSFICCILNFFITKMDLSYFLLLLFLFCGCPKS